MLRCLMRVRRAGPLSARLARAQRRMQRAAHELVIELAAERHLQVVARKRGLRKSSLAAEGAARLLRPCALAAREERVWAVEARIACLVGQNGRLRVRSYRGHIDTEAAQLLRSRDSRELWREAVSIRVRALGGAPVAMPFKWYRA